MFLEELVENVMDLRTNMVPSGGWVKNVIDGQTDEHEKKQRTYACTS